MLSFTKFPDAQATIQSHLEHLIIAYIIHSWGRENGAEFQVRLPGAPALVVSMRFPHSLTLHPTRAEQRHCSGDHGQCYNTAELILTATGCLEGGLRLEPLSNFPVALHHGGSP